MQLLVNGNPCEVSCREDDSLLHVLRNHLGLLGSRFGCGHEACGACMVLLDGVPSWSCTARAGDLGGRVVITVEGLPTLDALRTAFLEEQAGQCGYCLSGILVSAAALLQAEQAPDREAVVAALDRHLCRCGAHNRIVRAVLRAADAVREGAA